jgi:flagellar biosynthesis protein FliR
MIESFKAIPAGRLAIDRGSADLIFGQAADALALAIRAAAPPAVALAAAGVALGWLGRLAPSVPLMTLSLPIRAVLGVLLVSASLVTLIACLTNAWSGWGV